MGYTIKQSNRPCRGKGTTRGHTAVRPKRGGVGILWCGLSSPSVEGSTKTRGLAGGHTVVGGIDRQAAIPLSATKVSAPWAKQGIPGGCLVALSHFYYEGTNSRRAQVGSGRRLWLVVVWAMQGHRVRCGPCRHWASTTRVLAPRKGGVGRVP